MSTENTKISHLTKSGLLEETGTPLYLKIFTWFVTLIFIGFLVWTIITGLDEVASASGEIIPSGHVQKIQHLSGGMIQEITVKERDYIRKGEMLLRLDPLPLETQLAQKEAKLLVLHMKQELNQALIDEREPAFDQVHRATDKDVMEYFHQHKQQRLSDNSSLLALESQIEQGKAELAEVNIKEAKLTRKMEFLKEEMNIRKGLVDKGLNSKMLFLSLQRQQSDLTGEIELIPPTRSKLQKRIEELNNRLQEQQSTKLKNRLTELSSINDQIYQLKKDLLKLRKSYEQVEIIAPFSGYVHNLKKHAPGEIISAQEVIMELIPEDKEFFAEIKISSKDIGHVKSDQPVLLKFTTYDFLRYGGMPATLKEISPAAFSDGGEPYYKGIVGFGKNYFGDDPKQNPIFPGMTVTAEINTGKKTVIEYLLKPIFVSAKQAMRER